MDSIFAVTVNGASVANRPAIINLLQAAGLPTADLPSTMEHFFVAVVDGIVVGAIGLELYGHDGLLRSMVVNELHRGNAIAAQLLQQLESHAQKKALHSLYLLTETAAHYFERKGYRPVTRDAVPAALQASSEFSHVCPASAIVMKKDIQSL